MAMPRTPIKSEEEEPQQDDQGAPVDASLLPPGWFKSCIPDNRGTLELLSYKDWNNERRSFFIVLLVADSLRVTVQKSILFFVQCDDKLMQCKVES